MLKILIADDEKKVGLLVKELINWDKLHLELIDIVQDGQTAYDLIMEKQPDIVITDIRMPNLSGLDLIKRITEEKVKVKFVVISGYRYFEYAQQALKYGVEDYLLKPIDDEELNRILEKVCSEELGKQKELARINQMEKRLNNSKYILHRELIDHMINQNTLTEISEINKDYGVNLDQGFFRSLDLKVDRNIHINRNEQQEKIILQKLIQVIEKAFTGKVIDLVLSTQEYMEIMVLLNYTAENHDRMNQYINHLLLQMKDYIGTFENYEITMGVSREAGDFNKINLLLEMSREAINYRIVEGIGKRIDYNSDGSHTGLIASDIIKMNSEQLENTVDTVKRDQVCYYIRQCFANARQGQVMACEYYELARQILNVFCKKAGELYNEDMESQCSVWDEVIKNCISVPSLEEYLSSILTEYLDQLIIKRKGMERKPILETLEYIKNNYSQKILLEDIAEKFGFNATYFSEMFKNETGKKFSVYLVEVRMEAAKKLLRDTRDTIYDIADQVGYKDSKFFSQQFTKTVGIKPTEYRKLYY